MSLDLDPPPSPRPRRPFRLRGWQRWLLVLTVPYLGMLIMLVSIQRSLIYHPFAQKSLPAKLSTLTPGRTHDAAVRTEDGLDLRGWLVLAKGHLANTEKEVDAELTKRRPVVLYFGGNAADRSYRLFEIEVLCEAGADVLIFDYRGYGDSAGEPSEEGLARDARAIWRYATEIKKIEPRRLVLYGESLGGGVAVRLASDLGQKKTELGGLILRSTFNSLSDAASCHFRWLPVRWLLVDRFASDQCICHITCPLLQLHGRRDTIVPFRLGQQLFAAAPEKSATGLAKRFVDLPNADHNDVMETARREVFQALQEFFAAAFPK